ncbi:MAG: hypothetical protein NTZ49_04470 [Candidatus Parcubacteria bacterium]|nr:hypothetical protein [Candidatus Parcubacteria bacterium]
MNSKQQKLLLILKSLRSKLALIRRQVLADKKGQESVDAQKQAADLRAKIKNL